jgi:hypothetical protein
MEAILILGIIALIIISLAKGAGRKNDIGSLSQTIQVLASEIRNLRIEIEELKTDLKVKQTEADRPPVVDYEPYKPKPKAKPEVVPEVVVTPAEAIATTPPVVAPPPPKPIIVAPIALPVTVDEPLAVHKETVSAAATEPVLSFTEPSAQPQHKPYTEPEESTMDKWARNNPDLEKFIGENLINKIGIAIL